ncbi:MAG: guanylate kinase [Clostridium sp.]|uniref:guanylate kinase n=1 Tax=Clostridium sp. TaxID=1506 RepID=UPI0039E74319
MNRIICLVGESGAGKSVTAECLEREGYNYIKSYTTRPKRSENENGHIFVDENYFKNKYEGTNYSEELIAYTEFHGYRYWSTREQYKEKEFSVYVVEPVGAQELKNIIRDCEIIIVYLKVDRDERFRRMYKDRGKKQALERLSYDSKSGIFDLIQCDYVVDANRNIDNVVCDVKKIVQMN